MHAGGGPGLPCCHQPAAGSPRRYLPGGGSGMCCCKLNQDGHPSPWLPAARGDPSPAAASCDALSLQQALHNQMITAVQEISNLIEPVASAARAEASQLGHKVTWGWGAADEALSVRAGAHGRRKGTSSQGWKLLVLILLFPRCPRWLSTLSHSLWRLSALPPKHPTTSSR